MLEFRVKLFMFYNLFVILLISWGLLNLIFKKNKLLISVGFSGDCCFMFF